MLAGELELEATDDGQPSRKRVRRKNVPETLACAGRPGSPLSAKSAFASLHTVYIMHALIFAMSCIVA